MDIRCLIEVKKNPNVADFRPGDSVRVHSRLVEGDRERVQVFEGVVIRLRRGGINSNFTVRRFSHGVGVERTFPLYSPLLQKVEVVRSGRVRRAKLYYLRGRRGKAARIKAGVRGRPEEQVVVLPEEEEELEGEEAAAEAEEVAGEETGGVAEEEDIEAPVEEEIEAEAASEDIEETEEEGEEEER